MPIFYWNAAYLIDLLLEWTEVARIMFLFSKQSIRPRQFYFKILVSTTWRSAPFERNDVSPFEDVVLTLQSLARRKPVGSWDVTIWTIEQCLIVPQLCQKRNVEYFKELNFSLQRLKFERLNKSKSRLSYREWNHLNTVIFGLLIRKDKRIVFKDSNLGEIESSKSCKQIKMKYSKNVW